MNNLLGKRKNYMNYTENNMNHIYLIKNFKEVQGFLKMLLYTNNFDFVVLNEFLPCISTVLSKKKLSFKLYSLYLCMSFLRSLYTFVFFFIHFLFILGILYIFCWYDCMCVTYDSMENLYF